MINTIIQGDCLEVMSDISDKSIDAVITDIPYGTTACKWDVIIPFESKYLIKTYTKEKETVLDFTIGSGTTAIACINTNRNFIGIEKEEKYCEIARERIKQAKKEE
jgi:DNA modification methylase